MVEDLEIIVGSEPAEAIVSGSMSYPPFLKVLVSPAETGSSEDAVYVKVYLAQFFDRDDYVEGYPSLEKLQAHLVSLGILAETDGKTCLRYHDEEGDIVALTSDAELSHALLNHTQDTLKIMVVRDAHVHKKYLKTADGKYLSTAKNGTLTLEPKVNEGAEWEVIPLARDKIALRSNHNTFLSANEFGSLFVQTYIDIWEMWTVVPCGEKVAFYSHHNTYLSASHYGRLGAVADLTDSEHWVF